MFLPGRLRSTTLGDVLGMLHRAKVTGELELMGRDPPYQGARHEISVRNGLVMDVRTPIPVLRLGEVLLEHGDLTQEQHRNFLFALRRNRNHAAGQVLVASGLASTEHVTSALERQTLLRLDALFNLQDADLRFHPATTERWKTSPLPPSQFLHGRPRVREERSTCARSEREDRLLGSFRALGLSRDAPREDVRKAFRRLASSLHPDLHPQTSPALRRALESRFAEVSRAYHSIVTHTPLAPTGT